MAVSNALARDTAAPKPIAFIDLKAQQDRIRPAIDRAIARVLDHGQYIMGPEVAELERQLAAFCGARHALSCASGTDALLMILMAKGVGPGDAVLCPAFTYTATPEVIALLGATPVWIDVDADTFNVDPTGISTAVETARRLKLTPKGLIAVDLFGLPADYAAVEAAASREGLWVLADAAQSFGATAHGRKVGTSGIATATSFFPAKPLGCYGDGGAIFTDDDALAEAIASIRLHGKGAHKYDHTRIGINGRLDTIQAAILIEKLAIFPDEIAARDRVAARYTAAFAGKLKAPLVPPGLTSVWAQYTITVPAGRRDEIIKALGQQGIPAQVYYPKALHHQDAYRAYPVGSNGVPVSESLPHEVLSLPMHAYLGEEDQARIIDGVIATCTGTAT
ncbi:MAG: DegT/DnrJ/EryC1/StrS aminotransferase family protein [Hyphomicrobiaceae bacterium]